MGNRGIDLIGQIILIVEDQPMLALNTQVALEDAGAETVVARGPIDARARVRQFAFSAAIIDGKQRVLACELQQLGLLIVRKPVGRAELLARLAPLAK
jgi:CheY-like chemotaxis protein